MEERAQLLVEVAEGGVVEEEFLVDLVEAAEDGLVGCEKFALLDEGADDDSRSPPNPADADGGGTGYGVDGGVGCE